MFVSCSFGLNIPIAPFCTATVFSWRDLVVKFALRLVTNSIANCLYVCWQLEGEAEKIVAMDAGYVILIRLP